jgi:PAS domain S-box-containing protein
MKLGESGSNPRVIVTVHGFGYRFEPQGLSSSRLLAGGADSVAKSDSESVYALVSPDRTCLWISPSSRPILGFEPEDLEGKNMFELVHPDDAAAGAPARADLDSGFPAGWMVRVKASDGSYIPMETLVRPIVHSNGSVAGFLGQWRPRPHMDQTVQAPATPIALPPQQ